MVSDGNWCGRCSHCRKVEGIWETVASKLKKHNTRVGNVSVLCVK